MAYRKSNPHYHSSIYILAQQAIELCTVFSTVRESIASWRQGVVSREPFPGGLTSLIRLRSALLCKVLDREGFTVLSNSEQLAEAG